MHLSHSISCRTEIPGSYVNDLETLPEGWEIRGQSTPIQNNQQKLTSWQKQAYNQWTKLFCNINSITELTEWGEQLPNKGCSCQSFYHQHLRLNPPTDPIKFEWKYNLKSAINNKLGKSNLSIEQAKWVYRFAGQRGPVHHMITREDLFKDTQYLARLIYSRHPNIAGIAGIARSGMAPAVDIALMLGIDLYECQTDGSNVRLLKGGVRRTGTIHGERREDNGPIIIVDDSTCSGHAYEQVQHLNLPFYTVYAGGEGRELVDGYAIPLELPHFFSWNLMHSGIILKACRAAFDMDGVFCEDCPIINDDDGHKYIDWMTKVQPINWNIEYEIQFIITGRRETYREQTLDWLSRHGIRVKELVMFPGSFHERNSINIGQWKADRARERNCSLFIESDYSQACEIARSLPNCQVISIERNPNERINAFRT